MASATRTSSSVKPLLWLLHFNDTHSSGKPIHTDCNAPGSIRYCDPATCRASVGVKADTACSASRLFTSNCQQFDLHVSGQCLNGTRAALVVSPRNVELERS